MLQVNLVSAVTRDEMRLYGLYTPGEKTKPACILIHGFTGNFYSDKFALETITQLRSQNIASVTIENRGTALAADILNNDRNKDSFLTGSYYENIAEAHLDISAWIRFLRAEGYTDVVLIGHSLGTIKCVRYLSEGEYTTAVKKLVLLAPFDKNSYVEKKTGGDWKQHLEIAKKKIAEGKGLEIIPNTFDDFPMTYRTYYSWYQESELNSMWDFYRYKNYNFPILQQLNLPVKIIFGTQDKFLYMPEYNTLEQVATILKQNIKQLDLTILQDCDHEYTGFEEQVGRLVSEFAATQK